MSSRRKLVFKNYASSKAANNGGYNSQTLLETTVEPFAGAFTTNNISQLCMWLQLERLLTFCTRLD